MTTEAKFRALAMQDDILRSFFLDEDNGTFRIFDRQLTPGYLKLGKTCARIKRVSTIRLYSHETKAQRSQNRMALTRFDIDVLDYHAERARSAAAAIIDWLTTRADFSSTAQFDSPVTSPVRHQNQILNHRSGMEYSTQPPAYIEMIDSRLMDLED